MTRLMRASAASAAAVEASSSMKPAPPPLMFPVPLKGSDARPSGPALDCVVCRADGSAGGGFGASVSVGASSPLPPAGSSVAGSCPFVRAESGS